MEPTTYILMFSSSILHAQRAAQSGWFPHYWPQHSDTVFKWGPSRITDFKWSMVWTRTQQERVTRNAAKQQKDLEPTYTMDSEETPRWAQHLCAEIQDIKTGFDNKLDTLQKSIQTMNKETKAALNRLSNAEKRISALSGGLRLFEGQGRKN